MDMARQSEIITRAPLLSAVGLGVCVDNTWLIKNVDISVHKGEIVTLIGPNGSGKSTTVRALLGLIKSHAGSISRAAELRVGYVPQKLSIDGTMPLKVRRFMTITARHGAKAIDAALDEVGMLALAGNDVQSLSGGEFQRLLLARAMIGQPQLLVLD